MLMHKMTGIAVGAAERIAAIFVPVADVKHHLRGELMQFFVHGKLLEKLFGTYTEGIL